MLHGTAAVYATTAGSNFSAGTLALTAGGGLILGVAVTAIVMSVSKKRKANATQTV